jgi:hypothetical protein
MPDHATLEQLLAIKKHKEQSLTRALAKLAKQELALILEKEEVKRQHQQVKIDWQQRSQEVLLANNQDVALQKSKLDKYYQKNLQCIDRLAILESKHHDLKKLQHAQKVLQIENIRSQEKFNDLLENDDVYY